MQSVRLTLSRQCSAVSHYFIIKIPPATEEKSGLQGRCVICIEHGRRKDTVCWCRGSVLLDYGLMVATLN
jgi:hypothetical protein